MSSRPFKKFFWWFIGMLLICSIGISNVFAEETKTGLGYLNNSNVIISNNKGVDISLSRNTANSVSMDIKTIIFQSNYSFQKNVVYEYEVEFGNQYLNNVNTVRITSGNNICSFISLQGLNNSYTQIRFSCPVNVNYITISLSNLNDSTITNSYDIRWNSIYLWSITDTIDLGPIINNNNQNTQNIIDNNDENTQNIIDNNDENTQKIIDENKKIYESCENVSLPSVYTHITSSIAGSVIRYRINNNVSGVEFDVSKFKGKDIVLNFNLKENLGLPRVNYCFAENKATNEQQNCISGYHSSSANYTATYNLTVPTNANYLYAYGYINGSSTSVVEDITIPTSIEVCTNKLDDMNETNKGIFSKIKELFSWFSNDDDADISGLNNMVGWLPPGPVDSIINLPLAFFNALTNTLSGTCQTVSLTLPFVNQILVLPCFDSYMTQYLQHFGTFWTLVGSIVSIFILYNYLLALYKWVDDTLTFRENNLPGYYGDNWGGGA